MYCMKTVSEKMGIRAQMRAVFVDAPDEVMNELGLPRLDLQLSVRGSFDYIHLFVRSQAAFNRRFPVCARHLKPSGVLWVSWLKGGIKHSDLNQHIVIRLGYDFGMVESKGISLSRDWSALKFTHPKPGKVYNNSYGKDPVQ